MYLPLGRIALLVRRFQLSFECLKLGAMLPYLEFGLIQAEYRLLAHHLEQANSLSLPRCNRRSFCFIFVVDENVL